MGPSGAGQRPFCVAQLNRSNVRRASWRALNPEAIKIRSSSLEADKRVAASRARAKFKSLRRERKQSSSQPAGPVGAARLIGTIKAEGSLFDVKQRAGAPGKHLAPLPRGSLHEAASAGGGAAAAAAQIRRLMCPLGRQHPGAPDEAKARDPRHSPVTCRRKSMWAGRTSYCCRRAPGAARQSARISAADLARTSPDGWRRQSSLTLA